MDPRYLLDINICIYIAKQQPQGVIKHFEQTSVGEVAMSIITYGELLFGVEKSEHIKKNRRIIEELITLIPVLPLPIKAAERYAEIRNKLGKQGKIIGNNDLWIAAHALAAELTVITNNTKEFSRIPHLKVENWVN